MLLATYIASVLQQQVLGPLEDVFIVLGRFAVFAVTDLVDDTTKGGHDMELVKDDVGLG